MRPIHDPDGASGVVESDDGDRVVVRLPDGGAIHLPASLIRQQDDGAYQSAVRFGSLGASNHTLTEVEERLDISSRVRETGRVVARTVTETVGEDVDTSGWRETVEVRHVPVGEVVREVAPIRTEGDTTIIPVYEEVLVVRPQLVLREEVHLTTHRESTQNSERVALRRQRVEVERLPPEA